MDRLLLDFDLCLYEFMRLAVWWGLLVLRRVSREFGEFGDHVDIPFMVFADLKNFLALRV